MSEQVKRKRGRPKKIPLIDQKPEVQLPNEIVQIVEEVKQKEKQQEEQTYEEIKTEVKKAHNGGWDFTIEETPDFFDANCSYELTGYKPINATKGLDFDPSWFTEARDTYNRTGHYTQYRRGSKAYRDFWRQQYQRCKYGYTVNGYTVTGDHYFFLNFYQLKDLENVDEAGGGRKDIFPNFLEGQYEWFHYLKLARKKRLNACMMKARGAGYSEIEASILANSYNCIKGSINVACAFASTQLDKLLEKVWASLSFMNDCTDGGFFKSRQAVDNRDIKRASQYKMQNGQKTEVGWKSQIQGIVVDKPGKLRGDRTDILMFEEVGMWPNFLKAYTQADALVGQIGRQWGLRLLGGTGGETGPQMDGLREVYYNPVQFGVLPYRHNFTKTGESTLSSFFLPAFRTIKETSLLDNRGWLDDEVGKEYYNKTRKIKANNPQDLMTYCAEYCFTAEEAFSLEGENKFNKIILSEQLAAIRLQQNAPTIDVGNISYTYKNNNHSKENISGFQWKPDNTGKVHILEHPVWTTLYKDSHKDEEYYDYSEMNNLYVAGIDGIDIGNNDTSVNTDDPSKFCIVIKKRAFGMQEPQYVAYYKDRPNDPREAYKIAMCLAMYYKAPINIEATKIGMVQWAKGAGFFNWFMTRPDATYPAGTQLRKKTIGTPATPAIIDHQTELIARHVEDYGHTIWFEEMLDELMRYSDEHKTKFDIVAATGRLICPLMQ